MRPNPPSMYLTEPYVETSTATAFGRSQLNKTSTLSNEDFKYLNNYAIISFIFSKNINP